MYYTNELGLKICVWLFFVFLLFFEAHCFFVKKIQNLQTISVGFEDLCFEVLAFDFVFCVFCSLKKQ